MTIRCWLFGHDWGAPVDTNTTDADSERTVKCIRCNTVERATYYEEGQ